MLLTMCQTLSIRTNINLFKIRHLEAISIIPHSTDEEIEAQGT